jgi:hypothetical protein
VSARRPDHLLWGVYFLAVVVLTVYVMGFVALVLWLRGVTGATPAPTL